MPRLYALGNGHLMVQHDLTFTLRDLYYPHVGLWNHLSRYPIRCGVWVNDRFAWLDEDSWQRTFSADGTVVSALLKNEYLDIEMDVQDTVHPSLNVYARRMFVKSLSGNDLDIRIFYNHDLRLCETDIGDTAMFHPGSDSMIHFKRDIYLLCGGAAGEEGVYEYTTGIKDFNGQHGTSHDAVDGQLHARAIDQGSVDSTISFRSTLTPGETATFDYWIVAGRDLKGVLAIRNAFQDSSELLHASREWSQAWTPVQTDFSPEIETLYRQSLHMVRTQTSHNGAILAANDSDILLSNRATYSYVWPRDGALVAWAMDLAGKENFSRRYLEFCEPLLTIDQPFFLHKYSPDGTFGATWHPWIIDGEPETPCQEDETALTVLAVWSHYHRFKNLDYLQAVFPHLVRWSCDWMVKFRHEETGLPAPSYDLWEERRGIHAYTVASVVAALFAASDLAEVVGQPQHAPGWTAAAHEILSAAKTHMTCPETGRFLRCLKPSPLGLEKDFTVDSAMLAFGLFGILPWSDPHLAATVQAIEERLVMRSDTKGVARYENDYYFRRTDERTGNPWIICTMWYAQYLVMVGRLGEAEEWLHWACERASKCGVLSEQFHPLTAEPLSVSPLTWSHAEFVRTVQMLREAKA